MATKKQNVELNNEKALNDKINAVELIPGQHKRIVVAVSGFVYVGDYEYDDNAKVVKLTNVYNIRRWGTSSGLGQLAVFGKQKETVLDFCGVLYFPLHSVVLTMICNPEFWPASE